MGDWSWDTGSNNNNDSGWSWDNNSSNNNDSGWGSNNNDNNNDWWGSGSNNNNNNNDTQLFTTTESMFKDLPNKKKEPFLQYEKKVTQATTKRISSINVIISKLENVPDVTSLLKSFKDQMSLLSEKIEHYEHELNPFVDELKREFHHAKHIEYEFNRSKMDSTFTQMTKISLPPKYHVEKCDQFESKIIELKNQMYNVESHLNDISNNGNKNNNNDNDIVMSYNDSLIDTNLDDKSNNNTNILNTLNSTYKSILHMASVVILLHNKVNKLKVLYKRYRLDHYGDNSDPFRENKRSSMIKLNSYLSNETELELPGLMPIKIDSSTKKSSNNNNSNDNSGGWWDNNSSNNNNSNSNNNNSNNSSNNNNNSNNDSWNWDSGSSNNNNNNSSGSNDNSDGWTFNSNDNSSGDSGGWSFGSGSFTS